LSQKNLDYIIISFGINLIDSPENINSTNLFKEKFLNDDLNINKNQLNDWIKNINILLENIIENLKYFYKICIDSGFSTIKNIWLKNCYNLNQEISLFYKGKIESGRFIGIGEYGEIILQKNNTILKISSAEIISN
jgi:biotin-(acetyl-CoA carboxylase) ligase